MSNTGVLRFNAIGLVFDIFMDFKKKPIVYSFDHRQCGVLISTTLLVLNCFSFLFLEIFRKEKRLSKE